MTFIERNMAFASARKILDDLPIHEATGDIWDRPDLSSSENKLTWSTAISKLDSIGLNTVPEISMYFQMWASDAAVALGNIENALTLFPPPMLGEKSSMMTNKILSLKLLLNMQPNARDIITLFGPKVTNFAKSNIENIEKFIQHRLDTLQTVDQPISMKNWIKDAHKHQAGYCLFSGHASYLIVNPPEGYSFNYSKIAEKECLGIIRDAENTWREESNIPRIGEGWISETRLYYEIIEAFPNIKIIQHYRGTWLGRQHLDIGMPDVKIGLEYQGLQHDKPIAFFGGEKAFIETVKRDRRKLSKCRRNGWRLLYVREGYTKNDVIEKLRDMLNN